MKKPLRTFIKEARLFRGDGSIGSIEQFAGIRDRKALWSRSSQLAGYGCPTQQLVDTAMARCRKLAVLRGYRAQRKPSE